MRYNASAATIGSLLLVDSNDEIQPMRSTHEMAQRCTARVHFSTRFVLCQRTTQSHRLPWAASLHMCQQNQPKNPKIVLLIIFPLEDERLPCYAQLQISRFGDRPTGCLQDRKSGQLRKDHPSLHACTFHNMLDILGTHPWSGPR